jgi:Fe-S-cluster-containing hydrogenase component 2
MARKKLRHSEKITARKERCSGCGICRLACSLYHDGECNPSLSRIGLKRDFLSLDFEPYSCVQCDWPSCFFECPAGAVKIDAKRGARYIDPDACTGCGRCAKACPLMPEMDVIRFRRSGKKKIFFKCDLCRGRPGGPVCVQMCPRNALELA